TDCTMPPSGDGTSIVALSDSSAINGSSAFTVSPGLTKTSMIGTSLKSPMSGTRTSATPSGALVGDGGADTAAFGAVAAVAGVPVHTVQGSLRSVPSPYFLIAWSTISGLISPSSANALSAATTT